MKRGQTQIILSILVVSIFVAGFTPTQAAMGYKALNPGDQLLYKNTFTFYEDLEQQLFHEFDVADSWWVIDHIDYIYDEMESYYINSINSVTANSNYAWSLYQRYNNEYGYDYYYDYLGQSWVLNTSYSDYQPVKLSNFEVKDFDVYSGELNFDPTDWFNNSVYDHTEVKYYVINGINASYIVDVYIDVENYEITTPYTYAGINFDETNPYGWKDTFYVDSDTGFLLGYTSSYYDNYYRTIAHKNSPALGCFVDYYFNHTYEYNYEWQLYETTAAFTPVTEADLPVLLFDMGYNYNLRGDTTYLTIYFDLLNKYPYMTIDVLLDGVVIDTLYNMATGANYYELYLPDIPLSDSNHTIEFNVYDDANFEHNTTWSLELPDIRSDWPVITGPSGEYWYTVGDYETLSWELNDRYNNGDYYELKINGALDDSVSWVDGTIATLNLFDKITYAGDFDIWIRVYDTNAFFTDLYLTIHASDAISDSTPPTITGSTSDIIMDEGQDIKLIWTIYDENPSSYEIKVNGSPYDSGSWYENSKELVIYLKDFVNGVWTFEIIATDSYSNTNSVSITVTINEVIVTTPEPTEPTGTDPTNTETSNTNPNSNTLTLDSSSLMYSILGILSFVSIVVIYRKRR